MFVPAGDAGRVRPVDGKLAPHPADVQATSTKLYSENGCSPGTTRASIISEKLNELGNPRQVKRHVMSLNSYKTKKKKCKLKVD